MDSTPHIGEGLYTIPDAAHILRLPQGKLRRWLNDYWKIDKGLIWADEKNEKFFNFHTLIEIYTINAFRKEGFSAIKIKKHREELKKRLGIKHPFASTEFLLDSRHINAKLPDSSLIQLGTNGQLVFEEIIEPFCKKIDFHNNLAKRYWPEGKEVSSVVVDPRHCFGKPSIINTNISTETLYYCHMGGEAVDDIADMYEILPNQIEDAINFEKASKAA